MNQFLFDLYFTIMSLLFLECRDCNCKNIAANKVLAKRRRSLRNASSIRIWRSRRVPSFGLHDPRAFFPRLSRLPPRRPRNGIHVACTDYGNKGAPRREEGVSYLWPFFTPFPRLPTSLSLAAAYAYTLPPRNGARVGNTHAYLPRDTASPGVEIFTDVQRPLTLALARRAANPRFHPCTLNPLFFLPPFPPPLWERGENFLRTRLKPFPSPSLIPLSFVSRRETSILRDRRFVSVSKPPFPYFFLCSPRKKSRSIARSEMKERIIRSTNCYANVLISGSFCKIFSTCRSIDSTISHFIHIYTSYFHRTILRTLCSTLELMSP